MQPHLLVRKNGHLLPTKQMKISATIAVKTRVHVLKTLTHTAQSARTQQNKATIYFVHLINNHMNKKDLMGSAIECLDKACVLMYEESRHLVGDDLDYTRNELDEIESIIKTLKVLNK